MQRPHVSEAAEQVAVVEWCDANRVPVFHIPNGGKRGKSEAAYLKRQGVRAGVPDLCVPVARGGYHSLYVEMKVGTNKPTQKQVEWIALLRRLCASRWRSIVMLASKGTVRLALSAVGC